VADLLEGNTGPLPEPTAAEIAAARRRLAALQRPFCVTCQTPIEKVEWYYTINPPGGYGREEVLACEPCYLSEVWAEHRSRRD